MNWEAIGAVGEVGGAIAVVATLAYLAAQIRQSNRAASVDAKLTTTRLMSEFVDLLITTPELNDLFRKGRGSLEALSPEELDRFSNMSLKAFWFFSAGHFQLRSRTLDDEEWFELRAVVDFWIGGRGVQAWWDRVGRSRFGPSFGQFIDDQIARQAPPPG